MECQRKEVEQKKAFVQMRIKIIIPHNKNKLPMKRKISLRGDALTLYNTQVTLKIPKSKVSL